MMNGFGRIKEFLLLVEGFFQGEVRIDDLPDGCIVTCGDVVAEIVSVFFHGLLCRLDTKRTGGSS